VSFSLYVLSSIEKSKTKTKTNFDLWAQIYFENRELVSFRRFFFFSPVRSELDFHAVQRGDAEMEQKMNRVVRACVELGAKNPIVSIHDQGARKIKIEIDLCALLCDPTK
jgi:hypothetical protein